MNYGLMQSVESSNLAPSEKSQMRKWYDRMQNGGYVARAKHHATEGAQAVRAGGEALLIGGMLGLADAELKNGLDVPVGANHQIPLDGLIGVAGLVASVLPGPGEFVGRDLQNAGTVGLGIFSYRKTKEFQEKKIIAGGGISNAVSQIAGEFGGSTVRRKAAPARIAGDFGNSVVESDAIVAAARAL